MIGIILSNSWLANLVSLLNYILLKIALQVATKKRYRQINNLHSLIQSKYTQRQFFKRSGLGFKCTEWALKVIWGHESVWLEGVWAACLAGSFKRTSGLFCSVLFCLWEERKKKEKRNEAECCVVTVCSTQPSRSPEPSLEMEKEAATSAWSSPANQWPSTVRAEDTGIPCRAWGNGRSRGKLGHAAWVVERVVKELPRRYLSESRGELRQRETKPETTGARFQHQRDWTATRSLSFTHNKQQKNLLCTSHHGSHLDSVRCEAQKCQR